MDPRFPVTRDDLYNLQMDLKQIQLVQNHQAEKLARLERRSEQDASLKSVWQQSPFPSVLAGTPQQGPTNMSSADLYDMDEQDHLLSSLHLGPAEEEPARRGAASRANSVRFDESALRQSDWAGGHSNRHSGEFAPSRPSSGLLMERTLSHKSDGRHSSAGHSVHSFHSLASGRASSLGMHTDNFLASGPDDDDEDSPIDMPGPPPELFILGSVPTIIRCWLTTHFAHHTIQYADLCTGSQKSLIDYAFLRDMDLLEEVQRDVDGVYKITLPVYLVEATVTERGHRAPSPATHQIPSITVSFEVTGIDQGEVSPELKKGIKIFIGSDALRAHMADVLLSQNRMSLSGNEREKLSVPFVRPEDEAVFKHICTANVIPERPRLNATAAPFVSGEAPTPGSSYQEIEGETLLNTGGDDVGSRATVSPSVESAGLSQPATTATAAEPLRSEMGRGGGTSSSADTGKFVRDADAAGSVVGKGDPAAPSATSNMESSRRESTSSGIWGSWRQSTAGVGGTSSPAGGNADSSSTQRDGGSISGYQPAGRTRNMKVLKPLKSAASSARTGAAYEPPPPPRTSGEQRRKNLPTGSTTASSTVSGVAGMSDSGSVGSGIRWESKRAASIGSVTTNSNNSNNNNNSNAREPRSAGGNGNSSNPNTNPNTPTGPLPRSANPVGGASAFSWMNPAGKV